MTSPIESQRFYPPAVVGDQSGLNGADGLSAQEKLSNIRIIDSTADSSPGAPVDAQDTTSDAYWDALGIPATTTELKTPTDGPIYLRDPITEYVLDAGARERSILSHKAFLNRRLGELTIPAGTLDTFASSDFKGRDHTTVIGMINNTARRLGILGEADLQRNGDESRIAQEEGFLNAQMDSFAAFVDGFIEDHLEEYYELMFRYQMADEDALNEIMQEELTGDDAMIRRAAHRLLAVQKDPSQLKVDFISDFDLTMSTVPEGEKEDARFYLEPNVPASQPAEHDLEVNGRKAFPHTFAKFWNNFLTHSPHLFYEAGRKGRIMLREGVNELFTWVKQNGWETTILSANFGWIMKGALEGIPDAQDARIIAVWANDVRSTMKDKVLEYMAMINPASANIFIGDGSSDRPAVDARDINALNFALEGHEFAEQLEQAGAAYFTYRNMNDVMQIMERIKKECQMLQQRA